MEEAGLAMQTTTGHLSSMYTTVGNYRDVTVALIFFSRRRRRSSVRLQATRLGAFLSLCLSLCMVLLYIYIFFINTHRCKTHTRGRISTHVPVSCFFFFLCISLSRCGVATCYSFFGFVTGKNLPLEKSLRTNVFAVLSRTIFLCATFQRSVRPINSTANSLIRGNCAADTRAV